mmetsp:Transcript_21275/g.62731  ORF Transcript_21275/g.62731 Transcript_21275/m.62731 type:complete len:227 (+) Transcript_21275:2016-2696(+)
MQLQPLPAKLDRSADARAELTQRGATIAILVARCGDGGAHKEEECEAGPHRTGARLQRECLLTMRERVARRLEGSERRGAADRQPQTCVAGCVGGAEQRERLGEGGAREGGGGAARQEERRARGDKAGAKTGDLAALPWARPEGRVVRGPTRTTRVGLPRRREDEKAVVDQCEGEEQREARWPPSPTERPAQAELNAGEAPAWVEESVDNHEHDDAGDAASGGDAQ